MSIQIIYLVCLQSSLGLKEISQGALECQLHCVAIQDFLLDSCCLLEVNVQVSVEIFPQPASHPHSSSSSVVALSQSGPSDLQKGEGLVWVECMAVFQFPSRSSSCTDPEVSEACWRGVWQCWRRKSDAVGEVVVSTINDQADTSVSSGCKRSELAESPLCSGNGQTWDDCKRKENLIHYTTEQTQKYLPWF